MKVSISIINNLYNNFDKFPNLNIFYLTCQTPDINERFRNKFVKKLLSSLKLNTIGIKITKKSYFPLDYYSLDELESMYPIIKDRYINEITICKLTKEENCLFF